ncbi:unnamed protein product [Arabidopsis thaliana]|uniref:Uncharacterized protein n=1 Tax=Arabidopsis thaliana TaxID=3702 RepID=A0A5S9X132_ARATH|nr:unnamed protein product [Arabidopsis thaliana]
MKPNRSPSQPDWQIPCLRQEKYSVLFCHFRFDKEVTERTTFSTSSQSAKHDTEKEDIIHDLDAQWPLIGGVPSHLDG